MYRCYTYKATNLNFNLNSYLKNKPLVRLRLENLPLVKIGALQIREALFGGRTEAFSLYENNTTMGWLDVKRSSNFKSLKHKINICFIFHSLYPFVNTYCEYYVKTFKRHRGENCPDPMTVKGVALVTLLPPRKLWLPVLPDRCAQFRN